MIAILIPTVGRPDRIRTILDNIEKTTTIPHTVYIITEPEDQQTIDQTNHLKDWYKGKVELIINRPPHNYVTAINYGYAKSIEPFIFCGSDDIEFEPGWDQKMLKEFNDSSIGLVGAWDSWKITQTGKHTSHFMVKRQYIEELGGVEDERNTIYSSQYQHFNCDIETEQVAMKRGKFKMSEATIEHHHFIVDKSVEYDKTYAKEQSKINRDTRTYNQRRQSFEQYILEDLHSGKVTRVVRDKLSVVLASYNALDKMKETLQSLEENTYNDYELIIVDDISEEHVQKYIKQYQPSRPNIKVKRTVVPKKKYTNGVWNLGVQLATGNYIAIINNDITFSKNWDLPLMATIAEEGTLLANPWQTDPWTSKPYDIDPLAGCQIRGACYMLPARHAKQNVFPIPKDIIFWFGDNWVEEKCKPHIKFVEESTIFHNLSVASNEENKKTNNSLYWIARGDAFAFEHHTGIDTSRLRDVIAGRLGIK